MQDPSKWRASFISSSSKHWYPRRARDSFFTLTPTWLVSVVHMKLPLWHPLPACPPLTLSNLLLPQMRLPGPATTPQIPGMLSGTGDLNALPTSAPSSYLLPSIISESTSSAVTRISHTKRKVSSLVTDSVASLPKQSCPVTVCYSTGATSGWCSNAGDCCCGQGFFPFYGPPWYSWHCYWPPPATLRTYTHTTTQYRRISCTQKKNKNQATLFNKFGEEERKEWLSCRLSEIVATTDRMEN